MKAKFIESKELNAKNLTANYYFSSVTIPLSQARLCGTLSCSTIHTQNQCPICGTSQFLFLESILNGEHPDDKFKHKYRYCPSCNVRYKDCIMVSSEESIKYNCPVCGETMEETKNENVLHGKELQGSNRKSFTGIEHQ